MEVAKPFNPNGPVILKEPEAVETPNPMTAIFRLANPVPYLMMSLSANNILSYGGYGVVPLASS